MNIIKSLVLAVSAMATGNYIGADDPEKELDTAYDLVKEINQDLDELGLEDGQIALDIDLDEYEDSIEVKYAIETLKWFEDQKGGESTTFEDSYQIASPEIPPEEDTVTGTLFDSFTDSAIRVNGEVIRESLSPEYDHFD